MQRELFTLAMQSVRRKKRDSLLMELVLFLSVLFAVMMLSVTDSMNETNQEYRYDTYGTWNTAILDVEKWQLEQIQGKASGGKRGVSGRYGMIEEQTGIGTIDETLIEIGRIRMQDGRMPKQEQEIAMEADVLSALGYDYKIGQKIRVPIRIPAVLPEEGSDFPEKGIQVDMEYTLCGVIKEYTDLWIRDSENPEFLIGAVVTEEGAERLLEEGQKRYPEASVEEPSYQVFFQSRGDAKEEHKMAKEIKKNLIVNSYAYQSEERAEYLLYVGMIFLITVVAVICIYMLQIHKQVRQYALFRSLGITKRQLRMMLLYETIILCVPAILAGSVAGGIGTWFLLKIWMETGATKIYVNLPGSRLMALFLVWVIGIFAIRVWIFRIALRQPLNGRISWNPRKERRYRSWQRALSMMLAMVFGGAVIVSSIQYQEANYVKKVVESTPSYRMHQLPKQEFIQITGEDLRKIEQIPGIQESDAWKMEKVDLTFEGIENCELVQELLANHVYSQEGAVEGIGTFIYGIREEDWEEYLDFEENGIEKEKFREGSQVVLLFQVNEQDEVFSQEGWHRDVGVEEGENISIQFYGHPYEKNEQGVVKERPENVKLASYQTEVGAVLRVAGGMYLNRLEFLSTNPYTILCSDTALEQMIKKLPKGYALSMHLTEQDSGYTQSRIYASREAGYLSTDSVIAGYCNQKGLRLDNDREVNAAQMQESIQRMLQALTCGGCMAGISWLIVWNTRVLSSEREGKKYGILKALGMSEKQIKTKFRREAFLAGSLAVIGSWILTISYLGIQSLMVWRAGEETKTMGEILYQKLMIYSVQGIVSVSKVILWTIIIGGVVAGTWYGTRKNVIKQDIRKRLREEG